MILSAGLDLNPFPKVSEASGIASQSGEQRTPFLPYQFTTGVVIHLVLENVRTFDGRHVLPVAPLTILVGENSTGKSTFLASLATVTDPVGFPFTPGFNRPPYQLGNYDTIATHKGGRYGRARSFSLGYIDKSARRGGETSAIATYRGRDGQPELESFAIKAPKGMIALEFDPATGREYKGTIAVRTDRFEERTEFTVPRATAEGRSLRFLDLALGSYLGAGGRDRERRVLAFYELSAIARRSTPLQSESIAPIRTKPERTYSTATEEFTPGGDQIPFVLERLKRDPASKDSLAVMDALERFGEESGLFSAIDIRKLGSKAGEPFQVMAKIAGRNRNVVDVGYGVSQALPVVVQSALSSQRQMLLVQQPEVHLHPRAQAALGSFLAQLVGNADKRFVIESHSDFIIDRVRQEVAAGTIAPQDVHILFFERSRFDTQVHVLKVDQSGNILGAPPSYRGFFLQEELRLLSRGAR